MNEAKFTKGEWNVKTSHSFKCGAEHTINEGGHSLSESIANAHLIKTAPKMYEMLEGSAKMLDSVWRNTGSIGARNKSAEIKELLAEARGEQ